MKTIGYLAVLLIASNLAFGCTRQDDPAAPAASTAKQASPEKRGTVEEIPMETKTQESVIVGADIKAKWKNVKIEVLNKHTNTKTSITAPVGGELRINDSNMSIKVGDFLPDFAMDGSTITSASNEAKNPAAYITIIEDGKEIHSGWFFALYPDMHKFEHPAIAITLTGFDI